MKKLIKNSNQSTAKFLNCKFDFDDYIRTNNCEFGKYQKFLVCLLCIPGCFLSAFGSMDLVFMSYTPNHICNVNRSDDASVFSNNLDPTKGFDVKQCEYTVNFGNETRNETRKHKCHSWIYDRTYFRETVVTQWNLVCDEAVISRTVLGMLSLAGLFSTVFSYIQDRWGRKTAFLINLTIYLAGNSSSLLATNPLMFAVLKFIGSVTCMWEISYCWGLEFVGPSQRTALTTIFSVTYGLAVMSVALLAYLCGTWVEIGICTTTPFILLYSFVFFVPESPRWLLSQGRVDEALKFIGTMARWENLDVDLVELRYKITGQQKIMDQQHDCLLRKNSESFCSSDDFEIDYSVKKFFASSNLRWKCIVLTFICIISNQLYFAVPYNVENLGGNFYLSYVMQAAVEAPATLLNLFLLNRFGRILPLSLSLILSGIFCLLSWPTQSLGIWGPVISTTIARFFVCIGVAIIEQLGGELFPTVYRGISQGVSNFVLSIVSVSTQYIIYSSHIWNVLPMLIMGTLTLLSGICALFLPETKDRSLPDTVSQAEDQGSVGIVALKSNLNIVTNNYD